LGQLGHAAVNQFDERYNKLRNGKLKDFIYKTTTYADVISGIRAYEKSEDRLASDFEDEHPPPSQVSIYESSDSKSDSDTQSEESLDDVDPSNDHLVSGSDYSMCISENRLTHEAWYDENQDDTSSDEDEAHEYDSGLVTNGEKSEYNDSDYASE
jgi:hypothetical protein